jgi:predicted DCC family thiol-disulfide oxidoreductase YuxK
VLLVRDEREDDDSTSYPNELHPILLYDGVCGLCNRMVQFILKRDRRAAFRFAPLQGPFASRVLKSHGKDPSDLDTIYVVVDGDLADKEKTGAGKPDERLLARSDAAVFVMRELGGIWRVGATVLGWLPRPVRNWGYGLIARNRYRIFGRHDTCPVPGENVRERFLDI